HPGDSKRDKWPCYAGPLPDTCTDAHEAPLVCSPGRLVCAGARAKPVAEGDLVARASHTDAGIRSDEIKSPFVSVPLLLRVKPLPPSPPFSPSSGDSSQLSQRIHESLWIIRTQKKIVVLGRGHQHRLRAIGEIEQRRLSAFQAEPSRLVTRQARSHR